MSRGSIMVEGAYAQGKMLDNSGWNILPRSVTPSDCDMQFFDNNGHILLAEFSSNNTHWWQLKTGQRRGYESLVCLNDGTPVRCIACLCKHSVKGREINTLTDVDSFCVMLPALSAGVVCTHNLFRGEKWGGFVKQWFDDPSSVVDYVRDIISKKN